MPSDQSAAKVIYLAVKKTSEQWTLPLRNWIPAMNRFANEDYIKLDTCDNLNWALKGSESIKDVLGHRCPTLSGMSGSFLFVSCKDKTGLFTHQGRGLADISDIIEKKAEDGNFIRPSEYEGKKCFKNLATFIEPKLLKLYAKEYCDFPKESATAFKETK